MSESDNKAILTTSLELFICLYVCNLYESSNEVLNEALKILCSLSDRKQTFFKYKRWLHVLLEIGTLL